MLKRLIRLLLKIVDVEIALDGTKVRIALWVGSMKVFEYDHDFGEQDVEKIGADVHWKMHKGSKT